MCTKTRKIELKQVILLILFPLVAVLCESVAVLQIALYPEIAESRNATALEYTIVLGCYPGAMAIFSPFVGNLLNFPKITTKSLFTVSLILTSFTVMIFGFVTFIKNRTWFICISISIRLIEGLFSSIVFVSMYAMIPELFPEKFTKLIMGIIQSCIPLAYMVGPLVGTLLFSFGGFPTPFLVIGGTLGLVFVIMLIVPTNLNSNPVSDETEKLLNDEDESFGKFRIWKKSNIMVGYVSILLVTMVITFTTSTLEPYLRKEIGATPMESSVVIALSGLWSIITPISGYFGSEKFILQIIVLIGLCIQLFGVLLISPLPIPVTYGLTLGAVNIIDLGSTCTSFPLFMLILLESERLGVKNNSKILTYLSGMYMTALTVGAMIGPPISGILFDQFGFRNSQIFNVVVIIILITYFSVVMFKSIFNRPSKKFLFYTHKLQLEGTTG